MKAHTVRSLAVWTVMTGRQRERERVKEGAPAWAQLSSNKSESGQLLSSQSHHHRSGTCRVSNGGEVPKPPHHRALRHFPFIWGAHKVYSGAIFISAEKGHLKSTSTLLIPGRWCTYMPPTPAPFPSRHGRSIVQVICMIMPVQKNNEGRGLRPLLDINK